MLSYRRFERIYVYRPPAPATPLALLLSGDGGWSAMLGSLAQQLAAGGTLVAGIDVRHLLASLSQDPASCVSPASARSGVPGRAAANRSGHRPRLDYAAA